MNVGQFRGRNVAFIGPTGLASYCDSCDRLIWIQEGRMLDAPKGELLCSPCNGDELPSPIEGERK